MEFAEKGWPVFPVTPRAKKPPLTQHGLKDASTDRGQVRAWWEKWPSANIGIATGAILVFDVDPRNGGNESLAKLEREHGPLPVTLESRTGGGGRHLFFAPNGYALGNSTGKLGPGLDTRGKGGYAIVPPSVTEAPYQWCSDVPPAEIPSWVAAKLKGPALRVKSNGNAQGEKIPDGKRNATLTSLAGTMRRKGMSEAAILAALLQHNAEHCDPPLPESEVRTIAASIGNKPAATDDQASPFQGDQANAELLASKYAGQLIYLADQQVRCAWDGRVWRVGDEGSWGRAAIDIVRGLYLAAAGTADPVSREMLAKRAIKAEGRMAQMAALAQVNTKLERLEFSETFDRNPQLLNVANGIVDLSTGELTPHRPEALITKIINVPFVADAKCGMFEKFLAHTFDDNQDLIEYMTRFMGYALSGLTKEKAFWFFYGPTDTSKSTFVKLLRLLGGAYATTIPVQVLIMDRNKNQDHGLAELAGVRLATAVEIGRRRHLDEATVKQITGQDHIKACKKYQNYFEFRSAAKLIIATNNRPVIRETGDAIWRRVKSVPFEVVIPKTAQIDNLEEKLVEAEGAGILALAVRGFRRYLADGGLKEPREIRAAVEEYRRSEDVVAKFVDEHCVIDADARVPYGALYSKYVEVTKSGGEHPLSSESFARELERLGYKPTRTMNTRFRVGLRLRQIDEPEAWA